MMNLRLTNLIFTLLLLFHAQLGAQEEVLEFKVGVVDVQKIFKSYYKTAETQVDIDQERARIQKEDNEAQAELRVIRQRLQDLVQKSRTEGLADELVLSLLKERDEVAKRYEQLEKARAGRYQQANGRLDQQMKGKMTGILNEIRELVVAHAEAEKFTIVFEKAGTNTNQVPSLLYGKGMVDITDALMVELNKERPEDK